MPFVTQEIPGGDSPTPVQNTATGDGVDTIQYSGDMIFVVVAAQTGPDAANPTCDLKLQHATQDVGGLYSDLLTAAQLLQVTDVHGGASVVLRRSQTKRFVRLISTIGGADPAYFIWSRILGIPEEARIAT